ncbi:MAG: hypothetical protein H6739_23665 [Alphaproteobacteria bacterium]|nr:hypothetical protein [Alphaproteobacteria bacterium]
MGDLGQRRRWSGGPAALIALVALPRVGLCVPLDLPPDADPGWAEAAAITGFELEICADPPCARLVDGALELQVSPTHVERQPVGEQDPETALAVARSRLSLPAPAPPRSVPARPPLRIPAPAPPAVWTVRPTPDAAAVAEEASSAHGPAPEVHRRPPSVWVASAVGFGEVVQLQVHGGQARGPLWWGLGGRAEGRTFTPDLGGGVALAPGRLGVRVGAWTGLALQAAECFLCQIEESETPTRDVLVVRGPMAVPSGAPGWGPVARGELELTAALGARLALAPQVGVSWSAAGLRPEVALALRWQALRGQTLRGQTPRGQTW